MATKTTTKPPKIQVQGHQRAATRTRSLPNPLLPDYEAGK